MFLNNYQHLKNKEIYLLFFLFLFSFLIRIPGIFIFGDTRLDNEWGIIVNNLTDYGKFSLRNFGDFFVPSLLMPPLYAFYLYFFKIFHFNNEIYIQVVLFSQIILSSFSVVIFYNINKLFFSNKICILGTLIFSLFPLHIYACAQISSIILQSFLTITFFYFFLKTMKKNNFYNICFLSLASGLLILLRGEFIALFLLSILYLALFIKINLKSILIIILLTFVVISPYLMRNIIVLDTITITKSIGYNLWKGNNPNSKVEGSGFKTDISQNLIEEIPKDKFYRINEDKIYIKESIKNIKEDPKKYFFLYVKKALSYFFIDIESTRPNYYNPFHYIPNLLLAITSLIGILLSDKKSSSYNYLILILSFYLFVFPIFAIQPRYKIYIIPFQIIFTNIFINYLIKKRRQRVT